MHASTASPAGRLAIEEPAQRAAVLGIALVAFATAEHDALRTAGGLAVPPPAATSGRAAHTALCAVLRAGLAAALAGPGGAWLLGAVLDGCAPLKCALGDVGGNRRGWWRPTPRSHPAVVRVRRCSRPAAARC